MDGFTFSVSSILDMFSRLVRAVIFSAPWVAGIIAAPTAETCEDLIHTLRLDPSVRIILTKAYPDNSTFQDPYSQAYSAPATNLPQFCRVYANITTSPRSASLFEVWMSINNWGGRYLTVGNGGAAGGVNYPALGVGLRAGFATASTDGGHNSSALAGDWQGEDREVIIDFGW
jgi:feruloyl esterase